jgi:hypothetical protein
MNEVSDERLQGLIENLRFREGFANNAIFADELRSIATELLRYRDRPLHCPSCDGDHL